MFGALGMLAASNRGRKRKALTLNADGGMYASIKCSGGVLTLTVDPRMGDPVVKLTHIQTFGGGLDSFSPSMTVTKTLYSGMLSVERRAPVEFISQLGEVSRLSQPPPSRPTERASREI